MNILRRLKSFVSKPLVEDKSRFFRHWIISDMHPLDLAKTLDLCEVEDDCENYWEWIIGTDVQTKHRVDIYRTIHVPDGTKTPIFFASLGHNALEPLPNNVADLIIQRLMNSGVNQAYYGEIINDHHDRFDAIKLRTWPEADISKPGNHSST